MTGEEAERWTSGFATQGVFPWVTAGSDMEGYFCTAPYLSELYDISLDDAESWRQEAAESVSKARDTFLSKRQAIVRVIWPNGGSPDAEALWNKAGGKAPSTVKGKRLHAALKVVVKRHKKDDKLLDSFTIPDKFIVAEDLKDILERALKAP